MPLDQDLLDELMPLFRAESQENLQTLNQLLLDLEKQPAAEISERLLAEIFRAAHTLKGSARTVGLAELASVTHALESLIGRMQHNQVPLTPNVFDKAYHALDVIGILLAPDGNPAQINVAAECVALESIGKEDQQDFPLSRAEQEMVSSVLAVANPQESFSVSNHTASDHPQVEPVHTPVSAPIAEPATRAEPHTDETIRVAVSKLDGLFANVGELQAARISTEQRLIESRELAGLLESWEAKWGQVRPAFRRLLPLLKALAGDDASSAVDLKTLLDFIAANEAEMHTAHTKSDTTLQHLEGDSRRMAQVTTELQDHVRRMRMMPVSIVFDTFSRMVRDLARELDKDVHFVIEGGNTEVDRSMLEQIKPPLLHLLRNSIDHGIESPVSREQKGKPRQGTLTLSAAQRGASIVIAIQDDGAGIDPAQVKASAVKKGLVTAQAAQAMSDHEALWLIFRSGFSTRAQITDISGRGVGMDVVREAVEQLQGVIDLTSGIGRGTTITLTLPLTVAATLCLLARVGTEAFAVPLLNVERLVHLRSSEIGFAQNRQVIQYEGHPLVLVSLADALQAQSAQASKQREIQRAIILGSADKRAAFSVDELLGAQEVVVKNLPRPFLRVRYVSGATILGNGQAIVILNAADLLRYAQRQSSTPVASQPVEENPSPRVILIADDSITTRTLEKNILAAAGYQVRVAADGAEAWGILQKEGIAPDGAINLLVSDVNMPQLTGLDLTAKIRADERLKKLPVILVTSLALPQDRERGIEVGADAYIVKGSFDQDTLLATVRQLI